MAGLGPSALAAQAVRGRVVDLALHAPVAGAEVVVTDTSGTLVRRALTDVDGTFQLDRVPIGLLTLQVSALGYAATADRLVPFDGQSLFLEIGLNPAPVGTDGIVVSVTPQKPHLRLNGFYDRMRRGHGDFLGPEDVAARSVVRPSELLARVGSIKMVAGREPILIRNQRYPPLTCVPNLYIDGAAVRLDTRIRDIWDPDAFDNVMPPAEQIEALEVYPGGASMPSKWRSSSSSCGAIVVWTRH